MVGYVARVVDSVFAFEDALQAFEQAGKGGGCREGRSRGRMRDIVKLKYSYRWHDRTFLVSSFMARIIGINYTLV